MNQQISRDLLFKAPWGRSLMWTSWILTIALIGLAAFFLATRMYPGIIVPVLILSFTAPFTIRSYTISANKLLVRRLFWNTIIELDSLQSAEFNPVGMTQSTRSAGNGGLFSFSGYFTSKDLGDYRALVTDPHLAVVLRFPMETIVVSPENPQSFIDKIQRRSVNA